MVDTTPVRGALADVGAIEFRQVRRSGEESVFNGLIETYHYLGYTQPVGEHLKYLVYAGGRPLACFAWSSAPRHLGPRDRFIGWSPEARRRNIRFVVVTTQVAPPRGCPPPLHGSPPSRGSQQEEALDSQRFRDPFALCRGIPSVEKLRVPRTSRILGAWLLT
jgi:hypothetical protein